MVYKKALEMVGKTVVMRDSLQVDMTVDSMAVYLVAQKDASMVA